MIPTPPPAPVEHSIPAKNINTDAIAINGKLILDANIQPYNIKKGVTIDGVLGTYEGDLPVM